MVDDITVAFDIARRKLLATITQKRRQQMTDYDVTNKTLDE